MTHDDRKLKDFEERFRRWAQRPPDTPPEEAARRVVDRLPAQGATFRPWHGLAAAAVLALVVTSWLLLGPGGTPTPTPPIGETAVAESAHPADSDEVLLWLDESTPLYMTFAPAGQEGNGS